MEYREFGTEHAQTLMLLHGGGLSWWSFREAAELLSDRYHVVLPILDGHAGSGRKFTSIEDNAAELIAFIDERFGGRVLMIGGLSLGAQVLLEMLSQRGDICDHALVESASVLPNWLTHFMAGSAVNTGYGLINSRSFAKAQFKALHIKQDLFEEYYRDTAAIDKRDMVAFMKASTGYKLKDSIRGCTAKVEVYAGGKESKVVLKSVKAIAKALPDCGTHVISGLYHGEFSINHADEYAKRVKAMLE